MTTEYDVIIIGAGIGGLVSGCYLAEKKLKVLIVEQHYQVGGYCSSFKRGSFQFDVGVHYLGGIKRGILSKILDELDLRNSLKFTRFDPTDKIILANSTTFIRSTPADTINGFKKNFPHEKQNLDLFFDFITQDNFYNIYKKVLVNLHKYF